MKYKIVMFFNFWVFSKYSFLRLRHFISPSTDPLHSFFSVVVCIYKIHVFDEAFFLLAIVATITEKMSFFLFLWQPLLGKISSSNHTTY